MKIKKEDIFVMVVDIQENLFPSIKNNDLLQKNLTKLLKGLKLFNTPFLVCEQYPKGLGKTLPNLMNIIEPKQVYEKITFSACKNTDIINKINQLDKKIAIVVGTEAHVCVLQTCLDLIENDIQPILVVDCIGSREEYDKEIAIQRMTKAGVILTTSESLLFELCVSAENPDFKKMLQLIK